MPGAPLARLGRAPPLDDRDHLPPAGDLVAGARGRHEAEDLLLALLERGLGPGVAEEERIGMATLPVVVLVADVVQLPADLLEADPGISEVGEDEGDEQGALDDLDHEAESRRDEDDPMQAAVRILGSRDAG